jgi:hypothetical protein
VLTEAKKKSEGLPSLFFCSKYENLCLYDRNAFNAIALANGI